jgi:replicative DNA helicase
MNSSVSPKAAGGSSLALMPEVARLQSDDCEAQVIAHVLADATGEAWALAQNCGVKPEAFGKRENQVVWRVIGELRARGELAIDLTVLGTELTVRGKLDEVGGWDHLVTVSVMPSMGSIRGFAEQLVLLWQLRYTLKLAAEAREAALAYESREVLVETLSKIGSKFIRLGRKEATLTMAEHYANVEAETKAWVEGTLDKSRWVSSGSEKFDKLCGRFGQSKDDKFIVLAGGSGHGKSVGLRDVARASLNAGQRVLSYSRETGIHGFIEMCVSAQQGLDLNKREWWPKDRAELFYAECRRQAEQWKGRLYCVENEPATPLVTVEDIVDHARAWVHLHGVPEVILIDYLQLFDARKKVGGSNREALVAYVSHTLQALCRELGTVMIVAAQLNEAGLSEMRNVKRDDSGKVIHQLPHRGHLRESQAIYHDADRVIFLYFPPVDSVGQDQTGTEVISPEVWWFQEKRRRGGRGIVRMRFQKAYVRFVEIGAEEEAQAERVKFEQTKVVPKKQMMRKTEFTS